MPKVISTESNREFINSCSFFNNLSIEELDFIDRKKKIRFFLKGEVIYERDAYVDKLLFVKEGFVKLILQSKYKKNFILEFVGKGELVNVLFTGLHKTPITAVAHCTGEIYEFDIGVAKKIMFQNPQFALDLINHSTNSGLARFHRISSITLKQTRGKLADALFYNDGKLISNNAPIKISRTDLAELANLSLENTVRTLKEFEKEGLIELNKSFVTIKNKMGLQKVSNNG